VSDYPLTTEEVRNAFSLMEDDAATQENFQNFDHWLAEVRAQAWEEGYAAGDADAHTENRLDSPNPHKEENK
jgi:hypothetical protein